MFFKVQGQGENHPNFTVRRVRRIGGVYVESSLGLCRRFEHAGRCNVSGFLVELPAFVFPHSRVTRDAAPDSLEFDRGAPKREAVHAVRADV
jgi:hypothetical protein